MILHSKNSSRHL